MKKLMCGVLVLISAIAGVCAENCRREVALFLSQPSYEHYLELGKQYPSGDSDICWLDLKRDAQNLARLYEYTEQGNQWAVSVLIKHLSSLNGGELEDAYRAFR